MEMDGDSMARSMPGIRAGNLRVPERTHNESVVMVLDRRRRVRTEVRTQSPFVYGGGGRLYRTGR